MADNIGEAVLRERDPTKAIPPLAGALVKTSRMYNCSSAWPS